MQMIDLSDCGCKLLRKFRGNIYHWSVNEDRPSAPLDVSGIERNRIPQRTSVHTATRFRAGKLRPQFFRNEMVLVPKLHGPLVWNARQDWAGRFAPVCWQNRFPDNQHFQVSRPCFFQ